MLNGKIEILQPTEGLPDTQARAFFQDSRGRLWIGLRYKGVSMTEDPTARPPKFVNYSTENGLSADRVVSITEDNFGRIYFATSRGLDQLDPATGRIRHFTSEDGLPDNGISYCFKDSRGNIWVGTINGLAKLDPRAESAKRQLPIYLSRVQVAGEDLPLPETGTLRAPTLRFSASQNNLLIEYAGISFQSERSLRYQYKLDGVDSDWSPPTEQRSLNYARLAPGGYRFLVRAIDQDGNASPQPAVFEFRILAPFWQRWWFIALASTLVGLAGYAAYRYRVAQLIKLERVRTRIATDLHDDIGSNLSRIAILSGVASQQVDEANLPVKQPLSVIATTSRELVDSMGDIVWAINPNKDHLSDLVQRMRRFASDVFTARNIDFHFSAPGADTHKIGADVRRQVFLIFREAVNNAVRHSACTEADIELHIENGWLELTFKDNGKGFDPARMNDGNGLASMRSRAKGLGGELQIISKAGEGTMIILRSPLVATFKLQDGRLRRG
jgi:signal transduction histidine kinase